MARETGENSFKVRLKGEKMILILSSQVTKRIRVKNLKRVKQAKSYN